MAKVEIIKAKENKIQRNIHKTVEKIRVAPYCRVSTDKADQKESYLSQKQYYYDLIKRKKEWELVDIYADEAITGTSIKNRKDFQRLINDCMDGKIDMVITKSISRFARNTLDTIKYVRALKDRGVAVYFEEEHINTLTMDGELLLVVLSSVAQQEVENLSSHVKKGLKFKMERGELVGFNGALGYDYDRKNKTMKINKKEAEIVQYIFRRYLEGAGGKVIARELENLGHLSPSGNQHWYDTTVLSIIKNEKYTGDVLMGKSFTVDPISKRRIANFGEVDQYYIKDHHEAIISREIFDKAQEIRKKRAFVVDENRGKREKWSRKYAFSTMIECAFCGKKFSRRVWHSGCKNEKVVWECVEKIKRGRKKCPESRAIDEKILEKAFVNCFQLLCYDKGDVLKELISRIESTLDRKNGEADIKKIDKKIKNIENKKGKLLSVFLEDKINDELYNKKVFRLTQQIEECEAERNFILKECQYGNNLKDRINKFKKQIIEHEILTEFDRYVFESIVEKVIVGDIDENGNIDPYKITFILKTGDIKYFEGKAVKKKKCNKTSWE